MKKEKINLPYKYKQLRADIQLYGLTKLEVIKEAGVNSTALSPAKTKNATNAFIYDKLISAFNKLTKEKSND